MEGGQDLLKPVSLTAVQSMARDRRLIRVREDGSTVIQSGEDEGIRGCV